ncbi:unnamed protein product [Nezara viridula]|uniref:Ubiquinone biosynthesis protein n=1 Tax=Nezara viridula TaxID=85310 RepID=A0A9P0HDP0_NEZVI|nr:unnamed protein product [Nezara viridula]
MARNLACHFRKWACTYKHRNEISVISHEKGYCTAKDQNEDQDTIKASSQESDKEKRSIGIKQQILQASLPLVEVHGWTKAALSAGAEQLGYPGVAHGLFPKEGVEIVEYFYHKSNAALVSSLSQLAKEYECEIKPNKPSKNIILRGVETRLRMILPFKEKWPEALALMTLPPNIPIALANLLTIVDDICYFAGDRSIDMSWYGRRLALAGIYKTTELYMLSDSSMDHQKSWEFLRRRVDDAIQLEGIVRTSENAGIFAKDFATATFTTARNILGLNWNR